MYIDTHAHPNYKLFNDDYAQVIERAYLAGVEKIIIPSSNLETSKKAIEIARKFDYCYAAVGFHPVHIQNIDLISKNKKNEVFDEKEFLKLAQNEKVVAIGETGLDFFHDKTTIELQKEILTKHIKIAQITGKPIILHCREAYDDLIAQLMACPSLPKGVVHCWIGDWAHAQIFLDMGFYLSFTGIITFSKSLDLQEVIKNTPLNRIMIETDSPYLAPEAYRGERNEPAYVVEVAKKIAKIKKISLTEVERETSKNAIKFFNLSSFDEK